MSLNTVANDPFYIICDSLAWVDVNSLKQISKLLNRRIRAKGKYNIVNIIKRRLGQLSGLDPEKICSLLKQSGNMITGSFILQCVYGAESCPWKFNDIDVLTFSIKIARNQNKPHYRGARGAKTIFRRRAVLPDSVFETWLGFSEYISNVDWNFTHVGHETSRNDLDRGDEKYNYKSLFDFVQQEADFEFCKVLFDGEKLYIYNLEALRKQYDFVVAKDYRLLPYYQWGNNGLDIMGRLQARLLKYLLRGFAIESDLPASKEEQQKLNDSILQTRELEVVHINYERYRKKDVPATHII